MIGKKIDRSFLLHILLLAGTGNARRYSPESDQKLDEWKTRDGQLHASGQKEKEAYQIWPSKVINSTSIVHNKTFNEKKKKNQLAADKSRFNVSSGSSVIPDAIDYRTMGYVSSVDHQGPCKACWAFAVAGAVEALMAKKTAGRMQKLSSQQLLDCTGASNDCVRGGLVQDAMAHVKQYGLMTDCDYVYEAEKKTCKYQPNGVAFRIKSYIGVKRLKEPGLKRYIATLGPGVVNFLASRFFNDYMSGIYSTPCDPLRCTLHAALIVGYGSTEESGMEYWILKDSYGPDRGENGFVRFQRNVGLCGMGLYNLWPGN